MREPFKDLSMEAYDYFCILVSKLSDKHYLTGTSK